MMFRLAGLFAIIPLTVLLTISFFVLFARTKIESVALRAFAVVIALLLWLSGLLIFSGGAYTLMTGKHFVSQEMHHMMWGKGLRARSWKKQCCMGAQKKTPMPGMMHQMEKQ
jgi:hypothetical protein